MTCPSWLIAIYNELSNHNLSHIHYKGGGSVVKLHPNMTYRKHRRVRQLELELCYFRIWIAQIVFALNIAVIARKNPTNKYEVFIKVRLENDLSTKATQISSVRYSEKSGANMWYKESTIRETTQNVQGIEGTTSCI
jgi:hypothetical protein